MKSALFNVRKILFGLLTILLLAGATMLTACGDNKVGLQLSTETLSIQILSDDVDPQKMVTATITGTDDTEITASAEGYEEFIDVNVQPSTDGKKLIYVTGKSEGYAEVTVRTHEGNVTKVITVDVYSEVSAMSQKEELTTRKNNFAIRGETIDLIAENLIEFLPSSKSRHNVTFAITNATSLARIENGKLTINSNYSDDTITLTATNSNGVYCNIVLDVVDKLENNLQLYWTNNQATQAFQLLTTDDNPFTIVPNIPGDDQYQLYIKLEANRDLSVQYFAVNTNGDTTDDLSINAAGTDNEGNRIYKIEVNKEKQNLNGNYIVYFEVGYSGFNYSVSTRDTLPLQIQVREKVNDIEITNAQNQIVANVQTTQNGNQEEQVLYSQYGSGMRGTEYNVQVLPWSVIDATGRYILSVNIENISVGQITPSGACPIEFYFQDSSNNNVWTQALLEWDNAQGVYITREINALTATKLYIKAASDLIPSSVDNIEIIFSSVDNPEIETIMPVKLVKSASETDFQFENAAVMIDSTGSSSTDVNVTKQFTLQGQNTVEGLYVTTDSTNVRISQPVRVDADDDSITFSITFTLNRESFGITSLDSYQICHRNGLTSEPFDIDIFLPLKSAAVLYDNTNILNSVTNRLYSTKAYDVTYPGGIGEGSSFADILAQYRNISFEELQSTTSLSLLMLKNDTTTPVLYNYNTSNNYSAVAEISVSYFDWSDLFEEEFGAFGINLDWYKNLINSADGIKLILCAAANLGNSSDIAYFTAENSIITKSVGFTYAVLSFKGRSIDEYGNAQDITITRIVMIESYVAPNGMSVYPNSDGQVNLYAANTVNTQRDINAIRKRITINFDQPDITYKSISNFEFVSTQRDSSGNPVMGEPTLSGNSLTWSVTWENGRYMITDIAITGSSISFYIETLTNFGEYNFSDTLEIHYQLSLLSENGETITRDVMWTVIDIYIRNAQRVETLNWEGSDSDGIYFEIGSQEPYYMLLSTSPTNARNSNVAYVITGEDNTAIEDGSFVGIDNNISQNILGVKLSGTITKGTVGYLYLMPEDAVYNGSLVYFDKNDEISEDGKLQSHTMPISMLGQIMSGTNMTGYEYLVQYGYFQSNASLEGVATNIDFSEILLKVKITVADGSSFDYAYRIYDEQSFNDINPNYYYTIMNSLEIDSTRTAFDVFSGGLQGYNSSVTLEIDGANFANTLAEGAEIRNITFSGRVNSAANESGAYGFVVNENLGKLTNVTVDVQGRNSSILTASGNNGFAGGLTGINSGEINGGRVLGLTINGSNLTVGGVAGQNYGSIENSRVEFYNLADRNNDESTLPNTFTGAIVGGIAGQAENNSIISNTFAYNYNIDNEAVGDVLKGATRGAIIGRTEGSFTLDIVFAVLDSTNSAFGSQAANSGATDNSDYYYGYYAAGTSPREIEIVYSNEYSVNLIGKGDEGFLSYVNGEDEKHYANLYQDEKVTDLTSDLSTIVDENGYYRSLAVDSSHGILFYYDVLSGANDMTASEINDLNQMNAISLSELLENGALSTNIILSSSDTRVVKTIGSTIDISSTGEIKLVLSSKHDVSNSKEIDIKVVNALSNMIVSYQNNAGQGSVINENTTTYLQKTKSRSLTVMPEKQTIVLGNSANRFDLLQANYSLEYSSVISDENDQGLVPVTVTKISDSQVNVTADNNTATSTITLLPKLFTDETYQNAVNNKFAISFKIAPTDGVIEFNYSGESLPLTPSTNASIKVEVKTTAATDNTNLRPIIAYNGENMVVVSEDGDNVETTSVYNYALTQTDATNENFVLSASVTITNPNAQPNEQGIYSFVFEVSISVYPSYRTQIDGDMDFEVSFESNSGSTSRVGDSGYVRVELTKQNFTSVDVNTFKIESSVWGNVDGKNTTIHTRGQQVGVLSPGSSAIMQINVNPEFAYYDYMTLSYSGSTVSQAVKFGLLQNLYNEGDDDTTYYNKYAEKADANYYIEGNTLTYIPTPEEKRGGKIYFEINISSTVNADSILTFTASFFESEGNRITYVNDCLTISYLSEPQITIDGLNTSYVALGSTSQVQVRVLEDQRVESVILEGAEMSGIEISQLTDNGVDPITGIRTYTATLSTSVLASVASESNAFTVQARVSRVLNGTEEIKTTSATAVLVDFKIDHNNITIENSIDGNLNVWLGVARSFDVDYTVLPESYNYDRNDAESVAKVQELMQKRNDFLSDNYYPSSLPESGDVNYAINYIYDQVTGDLVLQTLSDRLYYIVDGEPVHWKDSTIDAPLSFEFDNETQDAVVVGLQMADSVQMMVRTYVTAGNITTTYETYFTVSVQAYSDPDLPLTISNATDFNNLNPENYTSTGNVTAHDYILENDIVLENFTPFDTNLISSLDGNGYTIFIKSFNTQPQGNNLNLALFNRVVFSTTLKNIRVNLYNGGQIRVNLAQFTSDNAEINVAGFAINNEGTITNCEVVSFYTDATAKGETDILNDPACVRHNNPEGINLSFIRGANTTDEVFITTGSTWLPSVAGFVLSNSGSITNSRVGGDEITILGNQKVIGSTLTNYTYATSLSLGQFNIVGQGDMAGFVLTNTGDIAASFVKQLDMQNNSNDTEYDTSGFAGTNTGSILTSFVEGVKSDESMADYSEYAYEGSSLKSNLGCIAGFVHSNNGLVKDSYSNILIANSNDEVRVYLVSGFVYQNTGTIETSYSASQIVNSRFTQMNFSGVNASGDLLAQGEYINCYFFNKFYQGREEASDDSTESQYATGAILVSNPQDSSFFYGFAIAEGETDGTWRIGQDGITLVEPNLEFISHRYIFYIDDDSSYEGNTAQNENGEYIMPYATLQYTDSAREIDTSLGKEFNPVIIASATDFVEVMGNSQSSYIQELYNTTSVWGNYRLVGDIDLSELSGASAALISTYKAFSGSLYGNGFTIRNLSITSDISGVAYGLFASIESRNGARPKVTNLDIQANQVVAGDVSMVGALAGYVKDAILLSIDITFADNARVNGLNFVGGLAGMAFGNITVKNITITNPTITAEVYQTDNAYMTVSGLREFRSELKNNLNSNTNNSSSLLSRLQKYSYAGSVIGFVDAYIVDNREFSYNQSPNYAINNVRATGVVKVQGQIVGGLFGLAGYQTNISDAGLQVTGSSSANSSRILSTKYFAGGIVGQSFGSLNRVFAEYDQTTQDLIEENIGNYYNGNTAVERGALDLFYQTGTEYSQMYIGGIAGYVGSGSIEVSYSKINVTSPTAEYAGGLFGALDLSEASNYSAQNDKIDDTNTSSVSTKYYMNEVYATGDVRANLNGQGMAGGLFGFIKGNAPRVAMLAVNAFNYFTTYDYQTGQYDEVDSSFAGANLSNRYKFNTFVGSTFDANGEKVDINIDTYTSYMNLMTINTSVNDGQNIQVPTVAYYQNYVQSGNTVDFNLFGDVSGNIIGNVDETDDTLYEKSKVYVISSANLYENASVGYTYTQQGFLSSGTWDRTNWRHPDDMLFPEIRYQRTTDVLYLDCYNVEQAFNAMNDSNVNVIVRGRVAEGSDEYADINLQDYEDEYSVNLEKINDFSGSITGGIYKVNQADSENYGQDVRIISEGNFIQSVGSGFFTDKLTVEYTGTVNSNTNTTSIVIGSNEQSGDSTGGLFIEDDVSESSISNLTMVIKAPVTANVGQNSSNYNFGLVASRIISTSITNLTIDATEAAVSNSSLITIDASNNSSNNNDTTGSFAAGVVTGELRQSSTISILQVNGINFLTKSDIFTISGGKFATYDIGTYFGRVVKGREDSESSGGELDIRINVGEISRSESATTNSNQKITLLGISSSSEVNVGGYIGNAQSVNFFGSYRENTMESELDINILGSSTITTLNAGLVFGKNQSPLSVRMASSSFSGGLYVNSNSKITNLNAGGFVGRSTQSMNIRNLSGVNFEVAEYLSSGSLQNMDKNSFKLYKDDNTQYAKNMVSVSGTANVGGVIGLTDATFSLTGDNSSYTEINSDGQSIRINSTASASQNAEVNIGSVIGKTVAVAGQNNSSASITQNVLSNANILVTENNAGATKFNVGGMIGLIRGNSSTSGTDKVNVAVNGSSSDNSVNYTGGVFSNVRNLSFGGMVGQADLKSNEQLLINRTAFGGVLKIFGTKSNNGTIYAGGSLGHLYTQSTSTPTLILTDNYNYGDVYAEYDNGVNGTDNGFTGMTTYEFGGLVAHMEGSTYKLTAQYNYSMTSSHNARYPETGTTNNALFGTQPVQSASLESNYYNFATSLCSDEYGFDIGYMSMYTPGNGYNSTNQSVTDRNMLNIFNNSAKIYLGSNAAGHKLNPITGLVKPTVSDDESTDIGKLNGMTYYTLSGSVDISSQLTLGVNSAPSTLKNIAIIGDTRTVNYTVQSSTAGKSLIDTLSGYSYVSGLIVNLSFNVNNNTTNGYYAGLANIMTDNSMVYAVQTQGSMQVGGFATAKVAGIVANMNSGKLYDCTTSLDIVYSAGSGGNVYGAVGFTTASTVTERYIYNSYTTGSIKSMIDANLYAFTNGSNYTSVVNCYSIAKLDWNDHTTETGAMQTGTILSVFGNNANYSNVFYDTNAINAKVTEATDKTKTKTTDELIRIVGANGLNSKYFDESDLNFNYGYPTLKFGFMKTSSYVRIDEEISKLQDGKSLGYYDSFKNKLTSGNYDSFVKQMSYNRLANNAVPAGNETVEYLVPNAGILAMIDDKVDGKQPRGTRFVLEYDIDLANTEYNEDWTSLKFDAQNILITYFDGQEHTISGLTSALFANLQQAEVFNLRLTEVNIDTTINDRGGAAKGILTAVINGGSASNITLEGNLSVTVTAGASNDIGALAGRAFETEISTITNLAIINVNTDRIVDVGGIVGSSSNSQIAYSSNYGPVNVAVGEVSSTYSYRAGGIVGAISAVNSSTNSISYSYNATSVLAGYVDTAGTSDDSEEHSALSTAPGNYYVGGVVGHSNVKTLTIDHCYNSGAIRSGNKSNGVDDGVSYAAGIIAYGANANVTNCHNEGGIEALAASPETEFEWEDDKLLLKQVNERNVYAYAIGKINSGEIENSTESSNVTGYSVFANGAYNEPCKIKEWNSRDLLDSITLRSLNVMGTAWQETEKDVLIFWNKTVYQNRGIRIEASQTRSIDTSDTSELFVMSKDSFGFPSSLIIKAKVKTELSVFTYTNEGDAVLLDRIFSVSYRRPTQANTASIEIDDFVTIDDLDVYSTYIDMYMYTDKRDTKDNFEGIVGTEAISTTFSKGESLRQACRSQEEGIDNSVNIGGRSYYIAETNNIDAIFNAGLYTASITTELGDLAYVNDISAYTVEATYGSTSLQTKIDSITQNDDGNYEIRFTCYSDSAFSGTVFYTINLNYEQTIDTSLDNLKYYYIDKNSIGIDIGDISVYAPINDYSLTSQGGTVYDKVIKAYEDGTLNQPDVIPNSEADVADDFLYFGVNDDGLLVYLPNATLTTPYETVTVNAFEGDEGDEGDFSENFVDNVQTVISNKLSNKILHFTITGSETRAKQIKFTGSGYGQKDIIASGSSSGDGSSTINYGLSVANWFGTINSSNSVSYDSEIELDISPNYDFDEGFTSFELMFDGQRLAQYSVGTGWTNVSGNSHFLGAYQFSLQGQTEILKLVFENSLTDAESAEAHRQQLANEVRNSFTINATGVTNGEFDNYLRVSTAGDTTITRATRSFTVTLNSMQNNGLLLDENNNVIMSYSNGTWAIANGFDSVTINGYDFSVTKLSGNSLRFTNTDLVASIDVDAQDVSNKLRQFKAIMNNFGNVTINDDLLSDLEEQEFTIEILQNGIGSIIGTFETTQTYNKSYVLTSGTQNLQINGNQVSFTSSRTGLTSYTANDVTVYYGTLGFTYSASYTSNFVDSTISINNEVIRSGNDIVVSYGIAGNTKFDVLQSTSSSITVADLTNVSGNITLEAVMYATSTYNTVEVQDDAAIKVAFNHASADSGYYVINGYRQTQTDGEGKITYLDKLDMDTVRIYIPNDKNEIYYTMSYEEGAYIYNYYVDDIIVLSVSKSGSGSKYKYYNIYENEVESGTVPSSVYLIRKNDEGVTIEKIGYSTELFGTISGNQLEPFVNYDDAADLVHFTNISGKDYIYLNKGFKYYNTNSMLDSTSWLEMSMNSGISAIEAIDYYWSQNVRIPEYVTNEVAIDISSVQKDTFSVTVEKGDAALTDGSHYNIDGSTVKLYLNYNGNNGETVTITAKLEASKSGSEFVNSLTKTAQNIILENDISLSENGFVKGRSVNIIGNGHYISYYGGPMFSGLRGNNSFVRDVKFLGENYQGALLFEGSQLNAELHNVSLYGSSSNFFKSTGAIINILGRTGKYVIELTTYASINAPLTYNPSTSYNNLTLISGNNSGTHSISVTSYGFISSANGRDGANGTSATRYGQYAAAGEEGEAGRDVVFAAGVWPGEGVESSISFNNKGVIKAGDGGNGGSGGSGYRAQDFTTSVRTGSDGGDGGTGGAAGSWKMSPNSNGNSALATAGDTGYNGMTGRGGLAPVTAGRNIFINENNIEIDDAVLVTCGGLWYTYAQVYALTTPGNNNNPSFLARLTQDATCSFPSSYYEWELIASSANA